MGMGIAAQGDSDEGQCAAELLPRANIERIMHEVLPQGVKISRDSKAFMQQCVHEFIGFLGDETMDACIKEGVMKAADLIASLDRVGAPIASPWMLCRTAPLGARRRA